MISGCGTSSVGGLKDLSGGGGGEDMAIELGDGPGGGADFAQNNGPCDNNTNPCPMGQTCWMGTCVRDNGGCTTDRDCQNDSWCHCAGGGGGDAGACMGGICLPYGVGPRGAFNPECNTSSFSSTDFKPPVVKCSWVTSDVIVTPVVVDLDLDGKPEIVFSTYPTGELVAIRGSTCQELWKVPATLNNLAQLAAADLDGDKFPEIIGVRGNRLVIYDRNGAQVALANVGYMGTGGGSDCSAPAIVDVDGMAPPEIAIGGMVARYVKGQGITVLFNSPATPAQWGTVSAMADLDGDNVPELITGRQVYDGRTGANKTPAGWNVLVGPGAYPAVADFNKDKRPDIVLVQSQSGNETVSIWDWAGQRFIFGPMAVQGGWGGPPTVADFDGDGTPDFGSAGPSSYFVFSMKCWPNGGPGCAGRGILWTKATKDTSSGGTGSSVFDFNGDGKAEVVYRDECFFRVLSGVDGKTAFAQQISSGTCLENPVVVDVDNDGHADVVVPSDNVQGNGCAGQRDTDTGQVWGMNTQGVFVLQDPMNRWMPSRSIWNQHTYHITNVKDDATIPIPETANWSSWNNYRQNVQGMAMNMIVPNADYTGAVSTSIDNGGQDCKQSLRLWAQICNRGTAMVNAGVPGTFYTSDPRVMGAMKICTATTKMPLAKGTCEAVFCDWQNPPQAPQNLWFRANDDGVKANALPECTNQNGLLYLPNVSCFVPG